MIFKGLIFTALAFVSISHDDVGLFHEQLGHTGPR